MIIGTGKQQLGAYHGFAMRYKLTWRFVFSDHKPTRQGIWLCDSGNRVDQACYVDKTNLLVAQIYSKDVITTKLEALVEVDGHHFRNFQWLSQAPLKASSREKLFTGERKLQGSIVGMQLWTTDHVYRVTVDGDRKKRALTEVEKQQHFASYGR